MTKGSGRKSASYTVRKKKVRQKFGSWREVKSEQPPKESASWSVTVNLIPSPREITKYTVFSLQTVTITLMNLANEKL